MAGLGAPMSLLTHGEGSSSGFRSRSSSTSTSLLRCGRVAGRLGGRASSPTAVCASGGNDDFDPFAEADENEASRMDMNAYSQSTMANSAIIAEEAQKIFSQFKDLSALQPKYNKFDVEGKRIFCNKMDELCDKMKVFTTRYQLSDDSYAQEMIRRLNEQLGEAGLTIDTMYEGLLNTTEAMKQMLEEEERLGAEMVYREPATRMNELPDFAKLMEDPEMAEILRDPEILKIMQKGIQSPEEFQRAAEGNPKIMKILMKLMQNMDQ